MNNNSNLLVPNNFFSIIFVGIIFKIKIKNIPNPKLKNKFFFPNKFNIISTYIYTLYLYIK